MDFSLRSFLSMRLRRGYHVDIMLSVTAAAAAFPDDRRRFSRLRCFRGRSSAVPLPTFRGIGVDFPGPDRCCRRAGIAAVAEPVLRADPDHCRRRAGIAAVAEPVLRADPDHCRRRAGLRR